MFATGTATDLYDLADKLHAFLTATGSAFGLQFTGTGNGTLTAYAGGASSVAEVFTITATDATHFSVVGSVSGSIGTATAGTPFSHAKLAFLITAGGTAFVAGDAFSLSTAPPWTVKRAPVTASSTRWRVRVLGTQGGSTNCEIGELEMMTTVGGASVCTGGTASASGGTTAANAFDGNNATACALLSPSGWVEYTFASAVAIKELAVKLSSATGGGTSAMPQDFVLQYYDGATWVPAGSWRGESSWAVGERRTFRPAPYTWQAPGNDGAAEILVGLSPIQNAGAGWYGWRLGGFTAFDASADFFTQPGAISAVDPWGPILPLNNSSLGYWFVANGRRVIVIVKSGAVYGAAYLGLIAPYASPGQWPYPLLVGGSLAFDDEPASTSSLWAVGTAHDQHTTFVLPYYTNLGFTPADRNSPCRLRRPDGSWLGVRSRSNFYDPATASGGKSWPYAYGFTNLKPDLDGAYSLYPVVLMERSPDNWYGQLEGIFAVAGNGLTAEASITQGRDSYVAFPDVTRAAAGDYFAVKLD